MVFLNFLNMLLLLQCFMEEVLFLKEVNKLSMELKCTQLIQNTFFAPSLLFFLEHLKQEWQHHTGQTMEKHQLQLKEFSKLLSTNLKSTLFKSINKTSINNLTLTLFKEKLSLKMFGSDIQLDCKILY